MLIRVFQERRGLYSKRIKMKRQKSTIKILRKYINLKKRSEELRLALKHIG